MKPARLPILAAALVVGLGFGGIPASSWAQSASPQQQSTTISEEDLQSFAQAAIKVQTITDTYQPRLGTAETEEERNEIRSEAMDKMVDAVEKQGLSVDKYNEIYQVAQSDPLVARKVNEYMEESQ